MYYIITNSITYRTTTNDQTEALQQFVRALEKARIFGSLPKYGTLEKIIAFNPRYEVLDSIRSLKANGNDAPAFEIIRHYVSSIARRTVINALKKQYNDTLFTIMQTAHFALDDMPIVTADIWSEIDGRLWEYVDKYGTLPADTVDYLYTLQHECFDSANKYLDSKRAIRANEKPPVLSLDEIAEKIAENEDNDIAENAIEESDLTELYRALYEVYGKSTSTEKRIIRLLYRGFSRAQTAQKMKVSKSTITRHCDNLRAVLLHHLPAEIANTYKRREEIANADYERILENEKRLKRERSLAYEKDCIINNSGARIDFLNRLKSLTDIQKIILYHYSTEKSPTIVAEILKRSKCTIIGHLHAIARALLVSDYTIIPDIISAFSIA